MTDSSVRNGKSILRSTRIIPLYVNVVSTVPYTVSLYGGGSGGQTVLG